MSTLQSTELATPAGPLAVVVDPDDGVVVAAGFGDRDVLWARLAPELQSRGRTRGARSTAMQVVSEAVAAYADGELDALEKVEVRQPGGPFQQEAWSAMRRVRAGRTVSYQELAALAGRPSAVRAAGSACARNLVAPFVPCHRILRSDGRLGGYAFGLDVKAVLLRHEGVVLARDPDVTRPER